MKRFVFISDTHGLHNKMIHPLPDGDVLVHAGDMCSHGTIPEVGRINCWFHSLSKDYDKIICIAGNHDWPFEIQPSLAEEILKSRIDNLVYLLDSEFVYKGIKIYGSPITPTFYNWAFMKDRGEKIKDTWNKIPGDTDVLVTHGPPLGILDKVIFDGQRVGCADLLNRVKEVKPKVHVFGHIHINGKNPVQVEKHYGIKFINASICDDNYDPKNKPVVIDI